jgi:hypothetical protein
MRGMYLRPVSCNDPQSSEWPLEALILSLFDLCAKGWHTSKELVVYGELYCVLCGVTRYAESSVVNY